MDNTRMFLPTTRDEKDSSTDSTCLRHPFGRFYTDFHGWISQVTEVLEFRGSEVPKLPRKSIYYPGVFKNMETGCYRRRV